MLKGALAGLAHGLGTNGNAAAFGEGERVDDVEIVGEEGLQEGHDGLAFRCRARRHRGSRAREPELLLSA